MIVVYSVVPIRNSSVDIDKSKKDPTVQSRNQHHASNP
jgi:hypothetical protein